MKHKISIVMTYYNRLRQLRCTLKSIYRFTDDVEIIIVDDASDSDQRANLLLPEFKDLHIIKIDKKDLSVGSTKKRATIISISTILSEKISKTAPMFDLF